MTIDARERDTINCSKKLRPLLTKNVAKQLFFSFSGFGIQIGGFNTQFGGGGYKRSLSGGRDSTFTINLDAPAVELINRVVEKGIEFYEKLNKDIEE